METETRPHKHRRGQQHLHREERQTNTWMQTRERGGEEERLNLLGDEDPAQRLDEASTAWRERGPRMTDGPAHRSLSKERGRKRRLGRERESERERAWWLVGNKNKNSRGFSQNT